jgi:hypothetical protein
MYHQTTKLSLSVHQQVLVHQAMLYAQSQARYYSTESLIGACNECGSAQDRVMTQQSTQTHFGCHSHALPLQLIVRTDLAMKRCGESRLVPAFPRTPVIIIVHNLIISWRSCKYASLLYIARIEKNDTSMKKASICFKHLLSVATALIRRCSEHAASSSRNCNALSLSVLLPT